MAKAVPHVFIDSVESKQCCWCNEIVSIDMFWKNAKRRDGLQTYCKTCALEWKRNNKEIVNKSNRASKKRNKEKNVLKRLANPEKAHAEYRARYQRHKAKHIAYVTARMKKMPWALHYKVSNNVRMSLKHHPKAGRAWQDLVGYNLQTLREHLNTTMPEGYTWDDYIAGRLHLDHIIPLAAHNISDADCIDFKKAWALSNLRLLPAFDNMSKNARLDRPFQPSLAMAVS